MRVVRGVGGERCACARWGCVVGGGGSGESLGGVLGHC